MIHRGLHEGLLEAGFRPIPNPLEKMSTIYQGESCGKEGMSATRRSNEDVFTINIFIQPKPEGDNSRSRPSSPVDQSLSREQYPEGPCTIRPFQVIATPHHVYQQKKQHRQTYASAGGNEGSANMSLTQYDALAETKLPFVWKLYEMLEDIERTSRQDIVSWVDNGRAFKVHKLKEFVDVIIPQYFKQSQYKSFQKQLVSYLGY